MTHGDLKDGYVFVNKTVVYEENSNKASIKDSPKTDAGFRRIPIVQPIKEFLDTVYAEDGLLYHNSSLVFSREGAPFSKTVTRRFWKKLMDDFGKEWACRHEENVPDTMAIVSMLPRNITAHMLRHTFITWMYDAGIDIKTAQKWSGHATVSILLDIYTHLSEGKEKESEDKLKRFFAPQKLSTPPMSSNLSPESSVSSN